MSVLVIAEHDNASIKGATLNTVTAAAACGGDVHILVAGHNAGAAAAAAAQIAGVAKVIHADAAGLEHGLAENVAAQVLAIAGNYSHILFPATAGGKNVAPRVAAKLDVAQISDITKVISADTFERPIYAGNAIATVQSTDAVKVITVRGTGFDAAAASGGSVGTSDQHMHITTTGQGRGDGVQGRWFDAGVVVFRDYECGHVQITLASFLSLSTNAATSATLIPAPRLGGSLTFRVFRRGVTSTPRSSGLKVSSCFFLAFMMLGSVT